MSVKVVHLLALILTVLALIPVGAHLFELPNKIDLPQDQYFIVQGIYRGWALFGIVLFPALAANAALTIMLYLRRRRWVPALVALLCVLATLLIFFTWIYPANQATQNWSVVPPDWQSLRSQWEYAHATNAVLTFAAVCLLAALALTDGSFERRAAIEEASDRRAG